MKPDGGASAASDCEGTGSAYADMPLVLLPGTLCDARLFAPVVERLGGVRVIHGDMSLGASTPELARALLERLPARFALAGFSLGGIVALEMIAQAPERVARLALIDTTARPDPVENASARREAAGRAAQEGTDGYILDAWDSLVAPGNRERRDLRDTLLAMARNGGAALLARQSEVAIRRADGRPRLGAIGVPVLVLGGEFEAVCPVEAHREIANGVPGAEFALVENAGHFAPLENPDAVAHHLKRWLARKPAKQFERAEGVR